MLNLPPIADAELNAECIQARKSMETIYGLFFLQRWRKIFLMSRKKIRELKYLQRCSERGSWAGARRGDHSCAIKLTNTNSNSYFCCGNQPKMPQVQYWFVCGDSTAVPVQSYSHWKERARGSPLSEWGWPPRNCRYYPTLCEPLQHMANTWFRWCRTVS